MERDSGKVGVRIGDIWVDMTERGTDFRGRAKPHIGYLLEMLKPAYEKGISEMLNFEIVSADR